MSITTFPDLPLSKSYQPQQLNSRHHEILRRAALGQKQREIAEDMGLSRVTITAVVNSELGRVKIQEITDAADTEATDVIGFCREKSQEAVKLLAKMVDGQVNEPPPIEGMSMVSSSLRFKAATEVLGIAGFGKVARTEGKMVHGYLGEVGLKIISERARDMGLLESEGEIIDVKAESSEVSDPGA